MCRFLERYESVNWDEKLRLSHLDHVAVFINAGVSGNVQRSGTIEFVSLVPVNMDAFTHQIVYHRANQGVVTSFWNWSTGQGLPCLAL